MDFRCKEYGSTALHSAAEQYEPDKDLALECVELLLKAGADPNVKTRDDAVTPLMRAASSGQGRMMKVSLLGVHQLRHIYKP